MEQLEIRIPYSFIRQRTRLTWNEVKYGIEERLLRPQDVSQVALDALEQGADAAHVADLALSSPNESVLNLVSSLASGEAQQDVRAIQRKWAFLVLAWIFEHRSEYKDPLDIVEKVYADLDYPEQVSPFIRYMPMDEPDLGSRELNEQRLIQRWAAYLNAESMLYSTHSNIARMSDWMPGK
jgi:hypothetical protein